MKIELREISIRDVVNGYLNTDEEGVVGYSGNLNIRPKYQREFIYKDAQRDAVIETVKKNFPLNVAVVFGYTLISLKNVSIRLKNNTCQNCNTVLIFIPFIFFYW